MDYTLVYHAGLPGRGEFVRLFFEATGTAYHDTAREVGQGAVWPYLKDGFKDCDVNPTPFAPPILIHKGVVISQTSNIMLYLSSQLPPIELEPAAEGADEPAPKRTKRSTKQAKSSAPTFGDPSTFHANEMFLTVMDLTCESHDVHHPISTSLYYEDQKDAALLASKPFRDIRVPKYLTFFESSIEKSGTGFLLKSGLTYADLGLFQALDALHYAFPKLMVKVAPKYPLTMALYEKVKESPRIKAYLSSERRTPYTTSGVFRFYPELDEPDS